MQTITKTDVVVSPTVTQGIRPTSITFVGADGVKQTLSIPMTGEEVVQLRAERQDLFDELRQVSAQRRELNANLFNTSDPGAKAAFKERVATADQRIAQIESDIAKVGQRLSAAPTEALAVAEVPNSGVDSDDWPLGLAVGSISTLMILSAVAWYRRRKRRKAPPQPAPMMAESSDRMERLEHGMEAIAIEIERISEGQRFVTKLMSESKQPVAARLNPES